MAQTWVLVTHDGVDGPDDVTVFDWRSIADPAVANKDDVMAQRAIADELGAQDVIELIDQWLEDNGYEAALPSEAPSAVKYEEEW